MCLWCNFVCVCDSVHIVTTSVYCDFMTVSVGMRDFDSDRLHVGVCDLLCFVAVCLLLCVRARACVCVFCVFVVMCDSA